jgi:hypothetical protein
MNPRITKWLWAACLFVFLSLLSAATFWDVLSDPDQVLAFNDGNVEFALSPTYRFPGCLFRSWDNQFFFGTGGGAAPLTITAIGETMGALFARREGQALILALCGLAIYWAMRQYGFSRPSSALTAAIGVSAGWSHNFAVTGLAVRPIALACTALALGFVERGRQTRGWLPYAIAGGCLGLGISEVPDVGAILAITSALIFWWTHLAGGRLANLASPGNSEADRSCPSTSGVSGLRPALRSLAEGGSTVYSSQSTVYSLLHTLPRFVLYVAFSVLLAWQMISVMFATQIQGVTQGSGESPESRYAWATQWSIPPAESWNIVSGNYFGSSMRSETSPYWGRLGRSEGWEQTKQGVRNFSMTGWHLGVVPCILLIGLFVYMFRAGRSGAKGLAPSTGGGIGGRQSLAAGAERGSSSESVAYPFAHPKLFTLMIFLGGAFSLMLMWGKHFPLYRLFWSLPYINTIRNPEKWNGPFTVFALLGIAFMLDILFRSVGAQSASSSPQPNCTAQSAPQPITINHPCPLPLLRSSLLWSSLGMAGLSFLILLATAVSQTSFIGRLTQEGYGAGAGLAHENAIVACVKVLIISSIFAGLIAFFVRQRTSDRGPQAKKTKSQKSEVRSQKSVRPLKDAQVSRGAESWHGHSARSPVEGSPMQRLRAGSPCHGGAAHDFGDVTQKSEDGGQKQGGLPLAAYFLPLIAFLALGDLFMDNRPYVAGHKYKQSLEPNPLTDFFDAHATEGRVKLMPPQHPLLNNLRLSQLQVRGYDLFDPVSVSRMPADYEALFKALEKQQSRLWELGSLKYFLTLPGAADELNKMDGKRGRFIERLSLGIGVVNNAYVPVLSAPANQRHLRVVEFTGALPKYRLLTNLVLVADTADGGQIALQQLASPDFNPVSDAILHTNSIPLSPPTINQEPSTINQSSSSVTIQRETPVEARVRITTDHPCTLVRATKYDPNWTAVLDNQPTPLLRANYLFQAVQVPIGTHEIAFSYRPSLKALKVSVSTRIALILMLIVWGVRLRAKPALECGS